MWFDVLQQLKGKQIDHLDRDEHDQFVVVHFTDGTIWVSSATRCNAAGCRIDHKVGQHFIEDKKSEVKP